MSQLLKKHDDDHDDSKKKQVTKVGDDGDAQAVAKKAKDLLKKMDTEKRKGGHFEICCGIKTWVPD